MSEYTKGPWVWINSDTDEPYDFTRGYNGDGYPSLRTVEIFGEAKTDVIDGKFYTSFALPRWILDAEPFDGEEAEANARLIAAAPDLLEALMNASGVLQAFATQSQTAAQCEEMALAAIAKATPHQQSNRRET